jgi:hypothetical protein
MNEQVWCYIARTKAATKHNPANTIVAAAVDHPEQKAIVVKAVAEWLRDNCTVERVPIEWAREHFLTQDPAP